MTLAGSTVVWLAWANGMLRQEVGASPDIFSPSSASLLGTGSPVTAASPSCSQACCGSSSCRGSDPLAWDNVTPSICAITLFAELSFFNKFF